MTIEEFKKYLELKEKRITDWEIFGLVPEKNLLSNSENSNYSDHLDYSDNFTGLTISDKYTFLSNSNGELDLIEL